MIYTSYFRGVADLPRIPQHLFPISIACSYPKYSYNFILKEYKSLAPLWWMVDRYRRNLISWDTYTEVYFDLIENHRKLTPIKVFRDIKDNALLLCWEAGGNCHRHLISSWFRNSNIACIELNLSLYI